MARIGVIAPSIPGHLNPVSCLGRALQSKGHTVTAFQAPYFEEAIRRSGLDFHPIGAQVFSQSRLKEHYAHLGSLQGMALLRYSVAFFAQRSQMYLAEAPE